MDSKKYIFLSIELILIMTFFIQPIFGRERTKSAPIKHTENPPRIDGVIDDACWESISPISGFFQFDPVNGAEASEETMVWISYDKKNLYFAFLMKDSQPGKIWAELTPRNTYERNDSITVILDAYNDKRTSISFTVNPKGVQKNSIETIWQSAAVILSEGWSAEMAVPFKSLRFSPHEDQVWGINFERYIHRLNEQDYWTSVSRDVPLLHQMGELTGLSDVRPGYNLEFFPYAGVRTSRWEEEKNDKVAAGLDVKYGILPNVILDLTASPDFSEVESDPFIFQRTPYENYFDEMRPFFNEGNQYFQLSTERRHYYFGPRASMFYTRRISNPKFAAKLSGKTGGYSFGLLGAVNEEEEGDGLYSIARVQKDILKNSQIGLYYAGMKNDMDYSRNFAVDYSFNFKDIYYLRGVSGFSSNFGAPQKHNGMHIVQFERDADAGIQLEMNFQRIEKNVNVRTGFITQTDIQTTELMTGYAWRFNQGSLKRFGLDLSGNLHQDTHGNTTGNSIGLSYYSEFLAQFMIHGEFSLGKSKYQIYDEGNNLIWTKNFMHTYGGDVFDFRWERGGFLKGAGVEFGMEKKGVYNQDFTAAEPGLEMRTEAEVTLRPLSNFEWSFMSNWIRQRSDETGETVFSGTTYATGMHLQITRSLFVST